MQAAGIPTFRTRRLTVPDDILERCRDFAKSKTGYRGRSVPREDTTITNKSKLPDLRHGSLPCLQLIERRTMPMIAE